RRQPWQMSKTRSSSLWSDSLLQKSGACQSRGWRVGASRLPSRLAMALPAAVETAMPAGSPGGPPAGAGHLLPEGVEGLLEAVGVGPLGLGERLEPVGDLAEALVPGGLRHARVHVGVLVGLARDGGLQVLGGGT